MSDLAELYRQLVNLKRTPRQGWLDRGVSASDTESVADHTLLTALIAWMAALEQPDLNPHRVLELAIIHDLAEAIVGDAPPYPPDELPINSDERDRFFSVRHHRSDASKSAKAMAESAAMESLLANLSPNAATHLRELWLEYEHRQTPESRFVKQTDILEAFLQSREYLRQSPNLPVAGFADMAANEIEHSALTRIRDDELQEDVNHVP